VHDVGAVDVRADEAAGEGGRRQLGPDRLQIEIETAEARDGGADDAAREPGRRHVDEVRLDLRMGMEHLADVAVERAMTTDVLAHEKHPHSLMVETMPSSVRRSYGSRPSMTW
jgi:hypothetical protein